MIQAKVKKIMLNGIRKYAILQNTNPQDTQIKITKKGKGQLLYEICKEFKPQYEVSFLDILDKKLDVLQFERLATPYLEMSITHFEDMYNSKKISVFLSDIKGNVVLSVFDEYANVKNVSLKEHFSHLGI